MLCLFKRNSRGHSGHSESIERLTAGAVPCQRSVRIHQLTSLVANGFLGEISGLRSHPVLLRVGRFKSKAIGRAAPMASIVIHCRGRQWMEAIRSNWFR